MTFDEALSELGVTASTLTAGERTQLDNQGYVRLDAVIDPLMLDKVRTEFERLSAHDSKTGTRHIDKLVEQGEAFEQLATHPRLLAAVHYVLKQPFRLMQFGGRDPLPGFGQQGLHADWFATPPGGPYVIVTALWMFDDFAADNGSTRLVPGTHKSGLAVPKHLADPASRHRDEIIFTGPAGSILVFNGHLWHSGTRNKSKRPRRSGQISFVALGNRTHGEVDPAVLESVHPAVRCVLTGVGQ